MKYQRGARSLETIILRKRYEFAPQQVHSATRATVPNNVLSHVCDMLATGREICSWLIKAPFNESRSYIDLAETFMVTNKAIGKNELYRSYKNYGWLVQVCTYTSRTYRGPGVLL